MRATLLVRDLFTLAGDSCVLEVLSDILDPHFTFRLALLFGGCRWGKHPSRTGYGESLKAA